jgi:hypothetical protein
MIRHMADEERAEVVTEHPNRHKSGAKVTKWIIVVLLLISVALMAFVTIGGWTALVGAKGVLIAYILIYLILAYYCARWTRGTLPLAAALGIILLIFAAIAGPEWYARDDTGYVDPAVPSGVLGLATLLLVPVQFLLIAFAMRGFSQNWHVEIERPRETGPAAGPAPA